MANEFRYTIRAQDRSREATQSANNNMGRMERSAQRLGAALKAALSVAAVFAIGRAVSRVSSDLIAAYAKQERAERQLAAAAANNPFLDARNVRNLQNFATELQGITTIGDEVSLELAAMAANWGRNEEEIKELITASANLSEALGMDLTTAARGVNNAMEGNVTTLSRYVPALRGLTEEQVASGDAMRVINEQFGGMAEAMRDTTEGSLKAFNNEWGDLKENLGGLFTDVLLPIIEALTVIINKLNEAFARRDARKALGDALAGYADVHSIQLAILAQEREIHNAQEKLAEAGKRLREEALPHQRAMAAAELNVAANRVSELQSQMTWLLGYQERLEAMQPKPITAPDLQLGASGAGGRPAGSGAGSGPEGETLEIVRGFSAELDTTSVMFGSLYLGTNAFADALRDAEGVAVDMGNEVERNTLAGLKRAGLELTEFSGRLTEGAAMVQEFNEFALDSLSEAMNTISMDIDDVGASLGGFAGELITAVNALGPWGAAVAAMSVMMDSFFQAIGPAVNQVLRPLVEALSAVAVTVASALLPVLNSLAPLFEIFAVILAVVNATLAPFREILGIWVGFVAGILMPVFKGLALLVVAITAPLQILGGVVTWVGHWIAYMGRVINDFIYNLTKPIWEKARDTAGRAPGGVGGYINAATTNLQDQINAINAIGTGDVTLGDPDLGGYGGGAAAQYTTGSTINMHIEINTEVIAGEEGIRQLAIMIRDEIRAAEALGA